MPRLDPHVSGDEDDSIKAINCGDIDAVDVEDRPQSVTRRGPRLDRYGHRCNSPSTPRGPRMPGSARTRHHIGDGVGATVISHGTPRRLPVRGVGCKVGPHALHPTTWPGRDDPCREEITTELTPRRERRPTSTPGPSQGRRTSGSIEKPGEAARAFLLVKAMRHTCARGGVRGGRAGR